MRIQFSIISNGDMYTETYNNYPILPMSGDFFKLNDLFDLHEEDVKEIIGENDQGFLIVISRNHQKDEQGFYLDVVLEHVPIAKK